MGLVILQTSVYNLESASVKKSIPILNLLTLMRESVDGFLSLLSVLVSKFRKWGGEIVPLI